MDPDPPDIEFVGLVSGGNSPPATAGPDSRGVGPGGLLVLVVLVTAMVGWLAFADGDEVIRPAVDQSSASDEPITESAGQPPSLLIRQPIPLELVSAELFATEPSAKRLRDLFGMVGGFEGLEVATAVGSFDLVRFDPNDPDRLLASHRSSYGDAENQQVNEIWQLTAEGAVDQSLWSPATSHDFVHFNGDGSITMWSNGGGDGFAPRIATVLDSDFTPVSTTEQLYASRFTSAGGTVFALTGNGDYYTNEPGYVDLVADDGTGPKVLGDGAPYAWIDNPIPGLLLAYPKDADGSTAVWDSATLARLPTHPLSGRAYRRIAISGDHTVAVGATFGGELEIVDLETGIATSRFGDVAIAGVDQPITLSHDATIAVTVENNGRVTIWWVGNNKPIASILASEAQPRWVSSNYAPTSASAIATDGSRIALRTAPHADRPTTWIIVDTDPVSWIHRACEQAGRSLTNEEANWLGLSLGLGACSQ